MGATTTALLFIGSTAAYVIVSGILAALLGPREGMIWHEKSDAECRQVIAAAFWPFLLCALPFIGLFYVPILLVRWYRRPRLPKAEVRR